MQHLGKVLLVIFLFCNPTLGINDMPPLILAVQDKTQVFSKILTFFIAEVTHTSRIDQDSGFGLIGASSWVIPNNKARIISGLFVNS
jgi:hypothetical protein